MKNVIFYIVVAAVLVIIYLVLTDRLVVGKGGKKNSSAQNPVPGIVKQGRKVGGGASRAFDSVDFGGKR